MNFYGHSVVAGWTGAREGGVLGSMLPDFESMTRVRVTSLGDEGLRHGIELHHRTDDVFHRAPVFVRLCRRALEELDALGVRRGTARAVSHIGTEMFLDGVLAADDVYAAAYLEALAPAHSVTIDWEDGGHAFERLRRRLERWGPPRDYEDPEFVLHRLQDALRDRPRLRVLDDQRDAVAEFLPGLRAMVVKDAPELLNDLRDALGLLG